MPGLLHAIAKIHSLAGVALFLYIVIETCLMSPIREYRRRNDYVKFIEYRKK
jgi:hypothetical protein